MAEHPKARDIEEFLKSGGSVCAYAKGAAKAGQIDYHVLPFSKTTYAELLPIMQRFFSKEVRSWGAQYRGGCMLIDEETYAGKQMQESGVCCMRGEALLAMQLLPDVRADVDRVRANVRRLMADPAHEILQPRVGSHTPVLFGMGPGYGKQFRRYAPHVMLPLTVKDDVDLLAAYFPDNSWTRDTRSEAMERDNDSLGHLRFYEKR